MRSTDKIIDYLEKTYQPESIIVYGSFADGSANLNSDFDALIIAGKEKLHDSSFVDGVVLDVFAYPPDQFLSEYDPAEFAQVWDGKIILDKNGMGERLKKNVLDYIEEASNPVPTPLLGHRCRSSQEITGSPTPFSTSNHYLWICASASFSLSNPNIAA